MADPLAPLGAPKFATSQQLADNLATDEQLKSTRDYAKALLMGSGQQPVHHWTQGVSNMVSALMGGYLDYGAAQKEKALQAEAGHEAKPYEASDATSPPVPWSPLNGAPNQLPATKTSFDGAPPSGGYQTAGGDDPEMAAKKSAIAANETGGSKDPYHSLGPVIKNPHSAYYGDRALGKYQVMGKNLPSWGQEVFGHPVTRDEFLNNPVMQEKMFEAKFKSPTQWFGRGNSDGYMTGDAYRARYAANMAKFGGGAPAPAGPVALPNSGSIQPAMNLTSAAQPDAGQTTAAVLRGDQAPQAEPVAQRGATPGINQALPQPQGGQQIVPSGVVPQMPRWSPQQVERALVNSRIPDAMKEKIFSGYISQNQPVQIPVTGGHVIVNPNNPAQQMLVPDVHYGTRKIDTLESPSANIITPGTGGAPPAFQTLTPQTLGPRSEATPSAAPAVAPGEGGNGPGATPAVSAENAPAAPAAATNPVQKAALQTAHAEASPQDVAQAEEGTAGAGGPTGSPDGSIAANSLRQFAQYGEPPPGVTPDEWATLNAVKDLNNRKAAEGAAAKKAGDLSSKKYEDITKNAELARDALNTVHNMQGLLNNPNMHFGLGKVARDNLSRVKDTWNTGTPGYASENAPNEIYDKGASSLVLKELKPVLQGTGQVRVAEIELLSAANANRSMSKEANQAILTMTERALGYANKMGELATAYKQEHGSLDAGFDKMMKQYAEAHPLFTPEENANYRNMLGLQGGAGEKKSEGGFPTPESRHVEELRANPSFRESFDKHFGPGAADKALGGK